MHLKFSIMPTPELGFEWGYPNPFIQTQIQLHRPDTHDLRVVLPAMTKASYLLRFRPLLSILRAADSADENKQGRQEIDAASFGI
jgi:hypothetical protein